MSLYSAFDLHGFFIADFFKNNFISSVAGDSWKLSNILSTGVGWAIFTFFVIKIVLAMGILSMTNNVRKVIPMLALFILYTVENITISGSNCGGAVDGAVYMCAEKFIVNPYSSMLTTVFFIVIFFKQYKIAYEELKERDEIEKLTEIK
jgi:hypothetical protein